MTRPSLHAALATLAVAAPATAQLAAGNVLVSTNGTIREYTPGGALVDQFAVPHPNGTPPPTEIARDLAVHPSGDLYVYNGTFTPYLSVRRTATGLWQHFSHPLWSTANGGSIGGVAILGDHVFVSGDQTAFVNGALLRFDPATSSFTVFGQQFVTGFLDVAAGFDGLLYALSSYEQQIQVFDPTTLDHLRTITLPSGIGARGVGVDQAGTLYVATWQQGIQRFDPNGVPLQAVTTGSRHHDVDLAPCGTILFGDWSGRVYRTDAGLSLPTAFVASSTNTFVAFRASSVPVAAAAAARAGVPPNPAAFAPGAANGPVLGATWQPTLTPFLPGAIADFVVVATAPDNASSPLGTMLFDAALPHFVCAWPAGAPLAIEVPGDCTLAGATFVAQAGSVAMTTCAFANALDVTIGWY